MRELQAYSGRPTPLYRADRLTEMAGGAVVYLKREDLNHTGAHKINNAIGQILLARRMGKKRIIAETGRGAARRGHRHGVRQVRAGVRRLHGGRGHPPAGAQRFPHAAAWAPRCGRSASGSRTLKDATNEAIRDWVTNVETTYYLIGSVVGHAPVPDDGAGLPVGDRPRGPGADPGAGRGGCPTPSSPASAGGATPSASSTRSSSDPGVRLVGVEAAGEGAGPAGTPPRSAGGKPGVLHGALSYILQDDDGQIVPAAFHLRRPRLSRAWDRSTPTSRIRAGPSTWRSPTRRRWRASLLLARPRGSSRRWRAPTPSPTACKLAAELGAGRHRDHQPLRPGRQGRAAGGTAPGELGGRAR